MTPPLTVSPAVVSVNPGSTEHFAVTGGTGAVRWSLTGAAGDKITGSGLFTAAAPPGRVVVVTATDSSGTSGFATVLVGTVIGPPLDLSAAREPGGTLASLSWEPPAAVAGVSIASYTVSTSPTTAVRTTGVSASDATIDGLTPTATYVVSVSARTTTGLESPPATALLAVGAWGAIAAPVPPGAEPGVSFFPGDPSYLISPHVLACPTVGWCVAVGDYGNNEGVIETLSDGTWRPIEAPLPSGAQNATYVFLDAIACPAVGSCVATGTYFLGDDDELGLIETLSGGAWRARTAPVPRGGSADEDLDALACPTIGSCVAMGLGATIETESGGVWRATNAPLPAGWGPGVVTLEAVACASVDSCVAVGWYPDSHGGLIEMLSHGTWRAKQAPLADTTGEPRLDGVSCFSLGSCVAVGGGTIDTLSGGVWRGIVAPLPRSSGRLRGIADPAGSRLSLR